MNRKQLAILLSLVVVVGIAGLAVYNRQNQARREGDTALGKKLLGDLPVNDVTQLIIKQGTNELHLAKKDELWRVRERNDYPANYSEISDFLLKAKELKIIQSEKVGASQLGRYSLAAGSGTNAPTVVELKGQGDKTIKTLLLGKKHMRKSNRPSPFGEDMGGDAGWPDGRYVKVGADAPNVALISEAFANIEPKPDSWLNKDFVKVEKVRAIVCERTTATNSWKLTRESESGEWKLADAKPEEKLDSSKIAALSNPLSSASFSDVDVQSAPAQLGLDKPETVTLETFDNFTYTFKVGSKTNDNYPVTVTVGAQIAKERTPGKDEKPEDKTKLDKEFKDKQQKLEEKLAQEKALEKWTYLVSSWTFDSVLKNRSELMQEKKEEPKKDDTKAETPPAPAADALSLTNSLPK